MRLFKYLSVLAALVFSGAVFTIDSVLAAPEQTGVFQEQVMDINPEKRTIFTYSEKTIRIFPMNPVVGKTKIVPLGKDEEVPLSRLKNGQWIAVKGKRFYDFINHAPTIDARVIYLLPGMISPEELKKLE